MRDLQELFERAKDYMDAIDVPYGEIVSVKVNGRYKNKYGTCRGFYQNGKKVYEIQIAKFLLSEKITDDKVVLSTICHEICHSIEGCMNHGAKWHYWMDLVADCYDLDNGRCVSKERVQKVVDAGVAPKHNRRAKTWEFQCENIHCKEYGYVWKYTRMPKFMKGGFNPNTMTANNGNCPFCHKPVTITRWTDGLDKLPMVY